MTSGELADLNSDRLRDETYEADILRLISSLPKTELTLSRVVGSAALGGFANDVIGSMIRSALMSSSGLFVEAPILTVPLLEGVRWACLSSAFLQV